jgi:hypothetical protein
MVHGLMNNIVLTKCTAQEAKSAKCYLIFLRLFCEQTKALWLLVFNVKVVNFDQSLKISCKPQISSSKLADCM